MATILGLDLGTNSLGWAVVEETEHGYTLKEQGVDIFQEGVAREKNNEKPAVQDRTNARALRRQYFRRRLRKIDLLRVLVCYDLCPPLSGEQLTAWRKEKRYPLDEAFLQWQRTDDNADRNPYHDRYVALSEQLDLGNRQHRYLLGRALYHLAQRRGFISNRKEAGKEQEEGTVKSSIRSLTAEMEAAGCRYLGEYFYQLYQHKEKIRGKYTSRNEHYLAEFEAICERQQLPDEWRKALHRAIFFQRDLKSQKGAVGRCTFEPRKSRCPVSHPRFEEFRMLQFINNIRITSPQDAAPRPLTQEEVDAIHPLFYRKSKPHFEFEEIARKIAGKGKYACREERIEAPYRFNFARTTTVSGCPITASLIAVFGSDWLREMCSLYLLGEGKNEEQVLNDVWHALFFFKDEECLRTWALEKLQLTAEQAKAFAAIRLPQDYAALSLNAINKILPCLRLGYRYDEAVFLANLKAVLPKEVYDNEERRHEIEHDIAELLLGYKRDLDDKYDSKEHRIANYFSDHGLDLSRFDRLYHPSMIETYRKAQPDAAGLLQLGSPRTPAVRNPMAMRALFRLRALVNRLLRDGKIDRNTKLRIEFARELNNANLRKAIEQYQREREAENRKFAEEIRSQYAAETGRTVDPTDDEVLKYRLWEQQQHVCPYTGRQIRISDFIGADPGFDIEHTIPRARGGDDSQMNKTLCENRYNRVVKRSKLPTELSDHAEIMARIESFGWQEKVETLQKQIDAQIRKSKAAATKAEKDSAIQRRHYLKLQQVSTSASSAATPGSTCKRSLSASTRSRVPRPPISARYGGCRRSTRKRHASTTYTTASTPSRSPASDTGSTSHGSVTPKRPSATNSERATDPTSRNRGRPLRRMSRRWPTNCWSRTIRPTIWPNRHAKSCGSAAGSGSTMRASPSTCRATRPGLCCTRIPSTERSNARAKSAMSSASHSGSCNPAMWTKSSTMRSASVSGKPSMPWASRRP